MNDSMAKKTIARNSAHGRFQYREWKTGVAMILPAFVILFIFNTIPLAMAVARAFQDYNTKEFVGLQNFKLVFADPIFLKSFGNVLWIGGACLLLTMVISFAFAHLIIRLPERIGGVIKILIYVPCLLSGVVISIIYIFLMNYGGGFFTSVLLSLGLEPIAFQKEGIWPYLCVIIPTVWSGLGYNTLVMMAGLMNIPKSLYEAASIDGANAAHKMWYVTLPSLRNFIVLMVVNLVTGHLQMLEIPYLITGGGPDNKTITPALYLFSSFRDSSKTPNVTIAGALIILIMIVAINGIVFVTIRSKKSEVD